MTAMRAPPLPAGSVSLAARSTAVVQSVGEGLASWLDLATRIWLAQAFLAGAAVSVMMRAPPAMAGPGALVATLNHVVASPLGLLTEVICPFLLLVGLASRLAAVLLLLQILLLHGPQGLPITHVAWSVLLGWTIVMGPGPWSIDTVLARGLDSSAIPGAKTIGVAFAWTIRHVEPAYRLAVRLGIAVVALAQASAIVGAGDVMRDGPLGAWTTMPTWAGRLPPGVFLVLGLLLLAGFGTRACALVLILLIPIGQPGMTADGRLYWTALLGLLACRGPGRFALDHWVAVTLKAIEGRMRPAGADLPHVVILGGGFAGVAAARGLRGARCRVTLVDRNNHHVFQPLLYQVATAGLAPAAIATPIRGMFRSQANLRVLLAAVSGVSTAAREVILDRGRLPFDFLVIATGARHSYFGRDEWAADAPGLKRIEDATAIRGRLLTAFERAEGTEDPAERDRWMTFVIVGGGPTGVELAGAIAELARHGLRDEYRSIDPARARVILVQSADRLLPTFPASLSADARDELRKLDVEILTGAKVEGIDADGVLVGGERIEARTVLWAAGVAASPAGQWLGAPADRAGRVIVGPDLSIAASDAIFAIGDTAASAGWKGGAVPGLAPAAKQGGAYVASVIRARLGGKPPPAAFRYRHPGSLATIGRRAAVADFGPLRLRGALAWWLWGAVHVLFLVGGRNRASVMLEWTWAYITYRRGNRLITEARTATQGTAVPAATKPIA